MHVRQTSVFYLAAPGWLRGLRLRIDRKRRQKKFGELTELNDYLRRDIAGRQEEGLHEVAQLLRR
jgi:hypothetical protein